MIDSVLKCEKVCRKSVEHGNKDLAFSDDNWLALKDLQETLLPAFVATKQLQGRELTLPDVCKIIDIAHSKSSELGNN